MLAEHITLPDEGDQLGGFRLGQRLSVSILGAFFSAEETTSGKSCLVHVLSRALLKADARFEGRYREASLQLSQLPPCAILPVVEIWRLDEYLVIQYPEGSYVSLEAEVLACDSEVPEAEVGAWLRTLAHSLGLAAEIGIGHYFLTPGFMFRDGAGAIRLAGLGLFQSIQYNQFESFVSGAILPILGQQSAGFPAIEILSPEIRNYKSRDRRSDFYCLGMCAYFFMTKRRPSRRWVLPVTSRPGIHPDWNLLISRCLEPSPSDRFTDFKEFDAAVGALGAPQKDMEAIPARRRRILQKLPTPGRLWGRPLRILRLLLLGLAGIMAIGTASMLLEILLYEESGEEEGPTVRMVEESLANLIIESARPMTVVSLTGASTGRFTVGSEGRLTLKAYPGRHRVRASAGHLGESAVVEVPAEGRIILQLEPRLEAVPVRVTAVPESTIHAVFEDHPDLFIGTTDAKGMLDSGPRFVPGFYRFVARHPAYEEQVSELVELPTDHTVTLGQRVRPTRIQVLSTPSGATVRIAGEVVGQTPLENLARPLETPIEVLIEKEGFAPYRVKVDPSPGQLRLVEGPLEPIQVEVAFQITTTDAVPVPAWEAVQVFLNAEPVSVAEGRLELPLGQHQVLFQHPDFAAVQREITISAEAATGPIVIHLEPLPAGIVPILPFGTMARFRVDGIPVELDTTGTLLIEPGKPVAVEAIVENYYSVTQQFEEKQLARVEWTVPLKPLPGPEPGHAYTPPYFDLPMAWIEPGRFTMGSPVTEYRRLPNEDNRTVVRFKQGFWMGTKEVSQALWLRIMGNNPSPAGGPDHPVVAISWTEAKAFCERLNRFEADAGRLPDGYAYRLPTEAEWEYAARAGSSTPFTFGATASPTRGNFSGVYDPSQNGLEAVPDPSGTLPCGSFPPNAWGLYDVHGNVAEWTLDLYWDRLPGGAVSDPVNLARGRGHPIRGGGWSSPAYRCRSSARDSLLPDSSRNWVGLRVVLGPALSIAD